MKRLSIVCGMLLAVGMVNAVAADQCRFDYSCQGKSGTVQGECSKVMNSHAQYVKLTKLGNRPAGRELSCTSVSDVTRVPAKK